MGVNRSINYRCRRTAALMALLSGLVAVPAAAHEGPPFPIVVDQPAGAYIVSVWADPDIGEAQFYIVVEMPAGEQLREVPHVTMWVEPTNGRLQRADYTAELQKLRRRTQFEVLPFFDQQDWWQVGFTISQPDGTKSDVLAVVESTPPGMGIWDIPIYLFPFVLFGGLWAVAMIRRSRLESHQQHPAERVQPSGKVRRQDMDDVGENHE